ncbi:MAG: PrgI family protein [bacterium]
MPQQFVVPQFIEVEDKIIGPISIRQFVVMLVGAFFVFLEYKLSDMTLFIVEVIPTAMIFGSFAFLTVNGQLFHLFLLNLILTNLRPAIRVWQPSTVEMAVTPIAIKKEEAAVSMRPTHSKLAELSLIVDTGGAFGGLPPSGKAKQ